MSINQQRNAPNILAHLQWTKKGVSNSSDNSYPVLSEDYIPVGIKALGTGNLLGSVGKMLMSRERREWTARRTLVLPQVMHAAMPRWRGLKWARMAGDCSTVRRKQRISSPVQMLEMLAWAGCSWEDKIAKQKRGRNNKMKYLPLNIILWVCDPWVQENIQANYTTQNKARKK